ncbi:MAG: ABC transporter substrate-binding protein [Desulfobacterales bacterium]|jgi:ABC-type branched-subunit amino acid transport system substrate-binding protein
MKTKPSRIILISLVLTILFLAICTVPVTSAAKNPVIIGFIGSFDSDSGKSTLRGAEIAIEELNAKGGILGGRQIKLVKADTGQDVTEGIKAYEYLNEKEKVDFIISGCIDDVSLGWLPRMAEYRTPTLDTWTSSYLAIEKVRNEYEKYKMYFMNVPNDWALGTQYVDFGKDILAKKMGWKTSVIMQEDTAYAAGVFELIKDAILPEAGIQMVDHVVYDVNTVDFSPIYNKITKTNPDFIYLISSVKCVVPTSQYVKLQVPIPITGINVAAVGEEYWTDTGKMGGGMSTLMPPPTLGMEMDPRTAKFIETYKSKYKSRPVFPHFNGFNAYYGIYNAVNAAERAGGFKPLDAWVKEMENEDLKIYKDGKLWLRYAYWKPGEIEPRTELAWPHNIRFDISPPIEDGIPSLIVIQWYPDGSVKCVYPPKYANGEFAVPPWAKKK